MDGELKKLTFSMDKANGESRTVIVIASTTVSGRLVRTLFDRAVTVPPNETMRLIREESMTPGTTGIKPKVMFVDDFTELERHVVRHLRAQENLQPMLEGNNEPIWKQHRPYGKKNRRRFK